MENDTLNDIFICTDFITASSSLINNYYISDNNNGINYIKFYKIPIDSEVKISIYSSLIFSNFKYIEKNNNVYLIFNKSNKLFEKITNFNSYIRDIYINRNVFDEIDLNDLSVRTVMNNEKFRGFLDTSRVIRRS